MDHIIGALNTTNNATRTTEERLAHLMRAIELYPTCPIAWRLVSKLDEMSPDYNRRYTRKGPDPYVTYEGKKLSMIDVSARIVELVPQDYNIWMWIGLHLLAQDGSSGGCVLACKILGKTAEQQLPPHTTVSVAGRQYNGMECLYEASTSKLSGGLWERLLSILRYAISSEYNIKAPTEITSLTATANHQKDGDAQQDEVEEYFGIGYCLAHMKKSNIPNWFKVWFEFPATQEVVYMDGKPFTSHDCIERVIEVNFEDEVIWLGIQHYLKNEGLHSKKDRGASRRSNSILFKGRLEITEQYCAIRLLEKQPSPANWKLLLETMHTDDLVCVNGKDYSVVDVIEASEISGINCSIHRQSMVGGGADYVRRHRCWECVYLEAITSSDDNEAAFAEFWRSLVQHMYDHSGAASSCCSSMVDSVVVNGTTLTLLQCLDRGLKHLPKHTQSWEILI